MSRSGFWLFYRKSFWALTCYGRRKFSISAFQIRKKTKVQRTHLVSAFYILNFPHASTKKLHRSCEVMISWQQLAAYCKLISQESFKHHTKVDQWETAVTERHLAGTQHRESCQRSWATISDSTGMIQLPCWDRYVSPSYGKIPSSLLQSLSLSGLQLSDELGPNRNRRFNAASGMCQKGPKLDCKQKTQEAHGSRRLGLIWERQIRPSLWPDVELEGGSRAFFVANRTKAGLCSVNTRH